MMPKAGELKIGWFDELVVAVSETLGVCRYVVGGFGKKSVPGAGPKLRAAGRIGWLMVQLPVIEVR